MGNTSQSAYSASKGSRIYKPTLKSSLQKALGAAICPGFIQTDMTEGLDDKVKEAYFNTAV